MAAALAPLPLFIGSSAAELQARWSKWQADCFGLLAAFAGSNPIGIALYQSRGTFAKGASLNLIALTASAQGQGLGSRMLAAFEAACSASRGGCFTLTSASNDAAQRFYRCAAACRLVAVLADLEPGVPSRKNGYQQVGALPGFEKPGVTELICWKPKPLG